MTIETALERDDTFSSVLVICTRNRSDELARALAAWHGARNRPDSCLLIDASDAADLKVNAQLAARYGADHVVAPRPGLARQRNDALDLLLRAGDHDVVHFIDDDTRVDTEYFEEIERAFIADPEVGGAGGIVRNQERPRLVGVKAVFGLYGHEPGRILRSGRNTIGHYPAGGTHPRHVEWLPGCCMSYRLSKIGRLRFDDRLVGYSWGEDFDFSFRLGEQADLVIVPTAGCLHDVSPRNRTPSAALAAERTQLLHRWVSENRYRGLSTRRFWVSVIGEIVLRVLDFRNEQSRLVAKGVAVGSWRQLKPGTRLRPQ